MSAWKNLGAIALLEAFAETGTNVSLSEIAAHLSARDEIISKYGEPSVKYQSKFCEIWEIQKEFPWFPAKKMMINKDFRKKITVAFQDLYRRGLHAEIKTYNGCYENRLAKGLKVTSLHAWALAMDLNAAENPLGGQVKFSTAFLQTMRDAGVYCGADWKRKDGMHFALYNG